MEPNQSTVEGTPTIDWGQDQSPVTQPVSGDSPGAMSVMPEGGQTMAPPGDPTINWSEAVVSSEPAEDVIEQNQTFLAETEPEPPKVEREPLFEEPDEPTLTEEEQAFLGEEGPSEDELEAQRLQKEIDNERNTIFNQLDDLLERSDKITGEQVRAIKREYKQLANEAREISRRREGALKTMGLRTGRMQYAPEIQSGIIANEQRALVTQLGKLAAMEAKAISEARQAQLDREFQVAAEKISFAKELRKEKKDKLDELQAKIEEEREIQIKINNQNRVAEIIKEGIYDPVDIQAMTKDIPFEEITAITDTYKDQVNMTNEAIDLAISSGDATEDEIAIMNDTSLPLSERKTAALRVVGRIQEEQRALTRRYENARIANIYDQMDVRRRQLEMDEMALQAKLDAQDDEVNEAEVQIKQDAEKGLNVLTLANKLKNHDRLDMGTGTSAYLTFGFGGKLEDFNKTHNQIKDLLTLDNLGLMKGVLSETDIQILASAATKLDPSLPQDEYVKELNTIINRITQSEDFVKARTLGYVNEQDYALAMGFTNEEILDMEEVGLLRGTYLQDTRLDSPQSYYGLQ